jgi:prepilin-type processing-associated H-X9-DG protein
MRIRHRERLWLVIGGIAALCAVAGPLLHARATALVETEAAWAAVTRALAALPTAGEAADTVPAGTPATSAQQAALLAVIDEYQRLLREGDYGGAWDLIHPDTRGEWDEVRWAENCELRSIDEYWEDAYNEGAAALMLGTNREVVDVVVSGDEGLAHIAMDVRSSEAFALKRHGDEWAIDLAGTENADAKQSISDQMEQLNDPDRLRQALWAVLQEEIGPPESRLDLATLPVEAPERGIVSATLDGDKAYLEAKTTGRLHVAISLEKRSGRWTIDEYAHVEVIAPDTDLSAGPPFLRVAGRASMAQCLSNVKQLALGYLMYASDYDERMPLADKWCDGIYPYIRNEEVLRCPADDEQWSYAMNYKASRQSLGLVERPAETIILFETEPSRKNAYDEEGMPGTTIANPERHGGQNVFAYVDGHAKAIPNSALYLDLFRLKDRTGEFERPWAWAQEVVVEEPVEEVLPDEGTEEPPAP